MVDEDPKGTPEDVERLRRERDELKERVDRLETTRRSKGRTVIAAVLVVLSVLLLAAAVPGTWTRRTVLNTDRYVEIVSDIGQEPEVQAYLATQITNSAFAALDVQGRLANVLGEIQPKLEFLAAPITQAVRGVVNDKVEELLASERFATLWAEVNRVAHTQILAVLRGDSDTVQISGDKVVINTLPLINETLKGVAGLASDLVGRDVTFPEITPESLSDQAGATAAIGKIESALGVDLPDDFGMIEVYDANEIEAVQQAVNTFDRGVVLLVVLWLLTFAGALAVSQRRRRTLLQLMVGSAVIVVLERRFAIASVDQIVNSINPATQAAGRAAAQVIVSSLLAYTKWLLAVALVTLVIALITGPYGWAVRLRTGVVEVSLLVAGMVRGTQAGPTARWVAEHRDAVMLVAAALFVLALLVFDLNVAWFLVLVVVLALVELAAWRTTEALASDEG